MSSVTPTLGRLAPTLDPDGKLDEVRCTITFTCPGCKKLRIAKAVTAQLYVCECGVASRVEAEPGEWDRLRREARARRRA